MIRLQFTQRLALAIVSLFVGTASVATEDSPPGLVLLRGYIDDLSSLRAEFRQEVVTRDLVIIELSRGDVALKKPGRFRWDYREPFERVISADGERVWLFEADLEQVTIRRLDEGLGATPAALLTGATDVLDHFDYIDMETEGTIDWVRLEPRTSDADFAAVRLGFEAGELVRIFLTDRLGQQTRIYLTAIIRGDDIDDAFFRFVPPEGVDVIAEDDI